MQNMNRILLFSIKKVINTLVKKPTWKIYWTQKGDIIYTVYYVCYKGLTFYRDSSKDDTVNEMKGLEICPGHYHSQQHLHGSRIYPSSVT